MNINKKENNKLPNNILYKYCSKEWHPIINANTTLYSFRKNETIFAEGEPVKGIYIIQKGKVKVFSLLDKYKTRIHKLSSDGKILGHRGFHTENYPVSAIALTQTEVSFIPNEIFLSLIKTNSGLSIFLINFLADELRGSEERMKSLMHSDVKYRMAKIIFYLIDSFGFDTKDKTTLAYCLARKDFAAMAGITYETTVRTLAYFQRKKLIKLEGKNIKVINQAGLKKYILSH